MVAFKIWPLLTPLYMKRNMVQPMETIRCPPPNQDQKATSTTNILDVNKYIIYVASVLYFTLFMLDHLPGTQGI